MSHLGGLVQDYGGGHCGYKNITLVSIDTLFTKQDTQVEFRLFSDAKNVSKHGTGLTIFSRASLVHAHTLVKQRHILVLYKVHTAHLDLHFYRAMLAANRSEQSDRITTTTKTMFSSHVISFEEGGVSFVSCFMLLLCRRITGGDLLSPGCAKRSPAPPHYLITKV